MFVDQIYHRISEIALLNPEKIAIYEGDIEYSYLQFKKGIDGCRLQISTLKSQSELLNKAGLYCDNSFVSHCIIYACALEGITYVPLSITDPTDRLFTIINIANIEIIFFDSIFFKKIESLNLLIENKKMNFVEINTAATDKFLASKFTDPSELYILFTSGSTGQPKGVSIQHQSVENYLAWAGDYLSVSQNDKFLSHSRITFDLSVFNLFLPFMFGSSTVLARSLSDQSYPGELLKKNVTIALIVPRLTNLLIQSKQLFKNSFTDLRHVLFCGEQLFAHQAHAWMRTHSHLILHNIYGPTETTVTCTVHTINPSDSVADPIPIGRAIPNASIDFLDTNDSVINDNEYEGEAVISGIGVSRHDYIGQKSNRFFNHTALGRSFKSGDILYRNSKNILFWRSRVDFQLKIRGYRVELSEIEIVLMSSKKINDAVCIYNSEKEKLFAFIETDDAIENIELELRQISTDKLPEYMNPAVYILLRQLPKNQNGKVDRAKLFTLCT